VSGKTRAYNKIVAKNETKEFTQTILNLHNKNTPKTLINPNVNLISHA